MSRRFANSFAISADGSRLIVGLFDEPARAGVEVVLEGFAALGLR